MSNSFTSLPYLSVDSGKFFHGSSYESLSIDDNFTSSCEEENNSENSSVASGSRKSKQTEEEFAMPSSLDGMSATERLALVQRIIHLFFNNRIHEAEAAVDPFKDSCQHFSHAKIQFVTISALLTLDPDMMEGAKAEVCRHLDLLQPLRPKRGFALTRMFGKEDMNSYTDEELIAELNYAEALIDYAIFTFLNGQSILTLIKAALKMNTAYNMLKFCHDAYKSKDNWSESRCRDTFEAGVLNAMGITNLVLSNLPTSILKILSLAGMSGNRDIGIEYLKRVSVMLDQPRIQWNFCMILGYIIYLEQMLGFSEYSGQMFTDWADEIASRFLNMYPNGAVPLFLNARVALLRSEPKKAINLYNRCLAIKNDWKQIDLFCIFDLVWAHAVIMDWDKASDYCDQLLNTCTWGHAINMHLLACLKWMGNIKKKDEIVQEEIIESMKKVEGLRKRYAGRSYPAEKLAVERAKRFLSNGNNMVLPVFELFHVWNVFAMMKRDPKLIQAVVDMIDDKLATDTDIDLNDKAVMTFLKGVCAKYLRQFEESIVLLNHSMKMTEMNERKEKSYIIPHALMEVALVHKELGNLKQSRSMIEQAKTNKTSSKYMLEALVQLKAHSVLRQLDQMERES